MLTTLTKDETTVGALLLGALGLAIYLCVLVVDWGARKGETRKADPSKYVPTAEEAAAGMDAEDVHEATVIAYQADEIEAAQSAARRDRAITAWRNALATNPDLSPRRSLAQTARLGENID